MKYMHTLFAGNNLSNVHLQKVRVCECFPAVGCGWRKILRGVRRHSLCSNLRIRELKDTLANFRVENQPDVIYGRWNSGNRFTVKSIYSFIKSRGADDVSTLTIWRLKIPTKVNIFLWLALKKRLPTVDNLLKRGWLGNNKCVMCGADLETVDHLLVGCNINKFLFFSHLNEFHSLPSTEDVNIVWEGLAD